MCYDYSASGHKFQDSTIKAITEHILSSYLWHTTIIGIKQKLFFSKRILYNKFYIIKE